MSDVPPLSDPFGSLHPRHVWVYAGFWFRTLAWIIDACILSVLGGIMRILVAPSLTVTLTNGGAAADKYQISDIVRISDVTTTLPVDYSYSYSGFHPTWHGNGVYEILQLLLPALYYVLFESSRLQGTPGKRVCRMRVTDLHGRQIGFGRATVRYVGHFLSILTLGLGFLMVVWTRRRQALHDLLAGTCVIRSQEEALVSFTPPT
ncbi:RDD family protein [Gluconacetobacter takamatsuzukensis]|uniref:RDD family protein n=1 Tax=Gluconacetobacter takamatsuzukensis TaxID=1286190 RepID=A0A7W4PN80_9PROT|nr:RDD family protein [Gluconacetobacter takamatsuzukensis]MBB2203783.1 RDD family protein [Gluconacetobacter takamatsuzukensis]